MKILYREIQMIPAKNWKEKLSLEKQLIDREISMGYPEPRLLRPLFGGEKTELTRVYEQIFTSYIKFAEFIADCIKKPDLADLVDKNHNLMTDGRCELFYIDGDSPVPRWMAAVSEKKFSDSEMKKPLECHPAEPLSPDRIKENIENGKLRIMYRLIQEVPKNKWAEKFEQERISDAVEALTGAPLPMRYRSMFGSQISQLRFNEREYESFEDFCVSFEDFLSVKDAANEKVMEAEIRRQSFFNWEREEIYVVDSDSYMPLWMNEV